jgi:hypothetical protein
LSEIVSQVLHHENVMIREWVQVVKIIKRKKREPGKRDGEKGEKMPKTIEKNQAAILAKCRNS